MPPLEPTPHVHACLQACTGSHTRAAAYPMSLSHLLSYLQGSQAYAKALAKCGILSKEESEQIVAGLGKVGLHDCGWAGTLYM